MLTLCLKIDVLGVHADPYTKLYVQAFGPRPYE